MDRGLSPDLEGAVGKIRERLTSRCSRVLQGVVLYVLPIIEGCIVCLLLLSVGKAVSIGEGGFIVHRFHHEGRSVVVGRGVVVVDELQSKRAE